MIGFLLEYGADCLRMFQTAEIVKNLDFLFGAILSAVFCAIFAALGHKIDDQLRLFRIKSFQRNLHG